MLYVSYMVCSAATPHHVLRCGRVRTQSQDVAGALSWIAQTAGATCEPPGACRTHPHPVTVQVLSHMAAAHVVFIYEMKLQTCSSGFAAVGPADRRCRSIAAAVAGECGQYHFVSVHRLGFCPHDYVLCVNLLLSYDYWSMADINQIVSQIDKVRLHYADSTIGNESVPKL